MDVMSVLYTDGLLPGNLAIKVPREKVPPLGLEIPVYWFSGAFENYKGII